MKITSFSNTEYRLLSERILDLLKPLSTEFDIDFSMEGGRHSTNRMMMKLVAATRDATSGKSLVEQEFRKYASLIGLSADDFGKTFVHGRSLYKITGLKLGAPKFNVLAERVPDGAGFKFASSTVQSSLKAKTAA